MDLCAALAESRALSARGTNELRCALCRHFEDDPAILERALPGMSALGSGHAATRAQDGLCLLNHTLRAARSGCESFVSII